jgi:epsilon-lactone hydrolase
MPSATRSVGTRDDRWSTVHPLSPQDQAVMTGLRAMVEPNKGKLRGIDARVPFDGIIG